MDNLTITGLQISTRVGVYPWEQHILQPLLLDISLPLDTQACHDQLDNTVDYAKLTQAITQLLESKSFQLIETVAEETAQLIHQAYPQVPTVKITVSKPKALKNAHNVGITIERAF